eukprot:8955584-Heterocapsa_arctica.AAC.1
MLWPRWALPHEMRTPSARRVSITREMNRCRSRLLPTMHHSGSSMYIWRREGVGVPGEGLENSSQGRRQSPPQE